LPLIKANCAWCGYTANRWMIVQTNPVEVWVCDVCAAKWRNERCEARTERS